jgi:GntR family transcriptional regulator/MocR family aminotransferase
MALWARVLAPVTAEAWASAAASEGVHVSAGREYSFEAAPTPFLRMGFACLDDDELREAVTRLERGLRRATQGG